jgi:hypothetical protein
MSIRFSVEVDDYHTENLLRYLESVFGDNEAHKLSVLDCARQWLELEDKTPPIFTREGGHTLLSVLSLVEDYEDAPDVSSLPERHSLQPPA